MAKSYCLSVRSIKYSKTHKSVITKSVFNFYSVAIEIVGFHKLFYFFKGQTFARDV